MPHPVDIAVGARIKLMRSSRGMTQTDLAKACGITFQQIQKYETAANRISISRLFQIADGLQVTPRQILNNIELGIGRTQE